MPLAIDWMPGASGSVRVAAGLHRRRVGRLLMSAVIEACEAAGKRQVIAVIGDSVHHASVKLHCALGFEHIGALRHFRLG